ncbi:hypothetical protein FHG87_011300 [Trinorchestia longiramus]|nr:hypothetical protein FHG87_011300 [Trinorchestia longiramus]
MRLIVLVFLALLVAIAFTSASPDPEPAPQFGRGIGIGFGFGGRRRGLGRRSGLRRFRRPRRRPFFRGGGRRGFRFFFG